MSKWQGEPKMTAGDALNKRMEYWTNDSNVHCDDKDRCAINAMCIGIGQKVGRRVQNSLMTNRFSSTWTTPILGFIERAAKQLFDVGGTIDDLSVDLIAEVAALRFESLELETRIRALERSK